MSIKMQRLSAEKFSRSKTELNRCTTTETRWSKKLISRLSPENVDATLSVMCGNITKIVQLKMVDYNENPTVYRSEKLPSLKSTAPTEARYVCDSWHSCSI